MRSAECEHCKSWVRYDASRFECARALSGFGCAFESRDGWKPKTYADLEKENAELRTQVNEWLNAYSDTSLVKVLRDCIYKNEKLSSQEQQELSAWVECAMDFGRNLDECADQLTKATELLKQWRQTTYAGGCDNVNLGIETEQFLNSENTILEDAQAGNSPFDADEVFNKEMKAYPEEKVKKEIEK